ncbi:hypothetical protein DFP73DRAFT_524691 [Morchella snyderi]|nr:hypothetical protein DFP73DRAFT_524691 [Morchella snyderi]
MNMDTFHPSFHARVKAEVKKGCKAILPAVTKRFAVKNFKDSLGESEALKHVNMSHFAQHPQKTKKIKEKHGTNKDSEEIDKEQRYAVLDTPYEISSDIKEGEEEMILQPIPPYRQLLAAKRARLPHLGAEIGRLPTPLIALPLLPLHTKGRGIPPPRLLATSIECERSSRRTYGGGAPTLRDVSRTRNSNRPSSRASIIAPSIVLTADTDLSTEENEEEPHNRSG